MLFNKNFLGDIESPRWIHIKGWLFLFLSILASVGILVQNFSLENCLLIAIALWSASRWYYYMFYVIEKYVDTAFKFAGLSSVMKYLLGKRK